jgi:sarcosine oxidase delta subunit
MKRIFNKLFSQNARDRVREYWRHMMRSRKHVNMSEGAQEVNRVITSAHKDEWRRGDKK